MAALYDLPTTDTKSDSMTSSLRWDEINVAGSIGSTATFELPSIGSNWFVPKLSYFMVDLKVIDSSNAALAESAGSNSATRDQFVSYPAAQVITGITHMINGQTVEVANDLPELSRLEERIKMPFEYIQTYGDSLRLGQNTVSATPGGVIQPWGSSVDTFKCMYVPPTALFKVGRALPGLRQRITLQLATSDLDHKCLIGVADSSHEVSVDNIRMYAAYVTPDATFQIPKQVVLSLPMMGLTKASHNTDGGQTHTFSVAPSTDRVYVFFQTAAGADTSLTNCPTLFSDSWSTCSASYAGQTLPAVAYEAFSTNNSLRPFLDFQAATGRMIRSLGAADNQTTWSEHPVYGFAFEKPPNSISTTLTIRATSGSNGLTLGVGYQHHKICVLSYGSDNVCQSVVVEENLK